MPTTPADVDLTPLLADADRLGITLDEDARDRFARYLLLIEEWNERAGITSVLDRAEAQHRHFGESLALLVALRTAGLLPPPSEGTSPGGAAVRAAVRIADLGPGGGFPGLPMRIVEPALDLVLIESNQRRAEFLGVAVQALGLEGVTVEPLRAEDAGRAPTLRAQFDLVVARALAAMPVLVEYALPLLRDGGVLAAPKGSRALDELDEAAGAIAALGGTALPPVALSVDAGAPPQTVLLVRREGILDDRYPRRAGMPVKRPLT